MRHIFLTERGIVELGANQPESAQGMRSDAEFGQRFMGRHGTRSHQHLFDDAATSYEESDGASDFSCEAAGSARQLGRDDDRRGNASSIQPLQCREMTGFQAADLSMDGRDGRTPLIN